MRDDINFVRLVPRSTRRSIIHYAIMLTSVGSGYETREKGGGGAGLLYARARSSRIKKFINRLNARY